MSQTETVKRYESKARTSAREAVQRGNAQRELQEKLRRIEVLKGFANRQFSKLNRSIIGAAVWMVVLGILFATITWFSTDILNWVVKTLK